MRWRPRLRPYEPLKARVGLSGVGAPQVEDKAAVHGPGLRVLVLGVQGNQQRRCFGDFSGAAGGWGRTPDTPWPKTCSPITLRCCSRPPGLVNDGHIPMALQVQLFRRGGGVPWTISGCSLGTR